jgi:6-pyruvoyltetrahydropterin/6-carboxytetrahydropterin synthase
MGVSVLLETPMKVTQAFTFEAAHRLPKVPATHRCHRMHGHSYRVEVAVAGEVDAGTGFVVDFFDIEAVCAPVIKQLDHYCLNDIAGLENPTAENIAVWIWQKIVPSLPSLICVKVYETPNCWAEYVPAT